VARAGAGEAGIDVEERRRALAAGPNRLWPFLLLRDPHYLMRGISLLPPRLGKSYVTRVSGYQSYDAGTFPVASRLEKMIVESDTQIIGSTRLDRRTPCPAPNG
jgi:hypothetical protein